jgi:hypothetical protein
MAACNSWGGRRPGAGRKTGVSNKATADVRAAAQIYGASAVTRLAEPGRLIEDVKPAESEQAQVAASGILDRTYGKAPHALTVDPAYAIEKTGLMLMEGMEGVYPPDAVAEWKAAIDEYFELEASACLRSS